MILGALAVLFEGWILWLFILLLLGRIYATPLDNITQLDGRRRVIAIIALVAFVLVFMPVPIQSITIGN